MILTTTTTTTTTITIADDKESMQNYPIGKEEEFILYMPSKVNLTENSKLITKQNEVSEIFFFFTKIIVANEIGKGVSFDETNHPSICKIKENMNPELSFNFSETEEHKVGIIIVKLQVKNATGVDKFLANSLN